MRNTVKDEMGCAIFSDIFGDAYLHFRGGKQVECVDPNGVLCDLPKDTFCSGGAFHKLLSWLLERSDSDQLSIEQVEERLADKGFVKIRVTVK